MFKTFLLALVSSGLFLSSATAETLFQIVSLDCQHCAAFSIDGAAQRVERYATSKGVSFKVGAFGPVSRLSTYTPEFPVLVFWAAIEATPDRSLTIAETMYRFYSDARRAGARKSRNALIDELATNTDSDPSLILDNARNHIPAHLKRWRKTARIAQRGMQVSGEGALNTPAFAYIEGSDVTRYVGWQGSTEKTEAAVKQMLNGDSQ